ERTTDDQGERQRGAPVAARRLRQPERQHAADADRKQGEEPFLPATGTGEEAERRAGVVGAIPVPETFDHRDGGVLGQARQHPGLGPLVERDDDDRQHQPHQRTGLCLDLWIRHQNHFLSSPGPSTLDTQRPHSCGCSATPPTSARCCQQRTHLGLPVGVAMMRDSLPSNGTTVTSPLISRKRSSSTSGATRIWSAVPACNSISASSAAPISPLARIGSSTLATCSRSSSRRSKSL